MRHPLIVGGSDAGISAGLRARELDPGCEVTIVMADRYPNYSICGLLFYLSGEVTYIIDRQGIVRRMFFSQYTSKKHVDVALQTLQSICGGHV